MNDKEEKTIKKIYENYENIEKSLVSQLTLETPNHYLTQGTYRESVWKSLFETIIPKKFCIDQGVFIIDSQGNISAEVDLAIFDEQYTPYIFNYGKIKFIPIEAVAVVIQCKSDSFTEDNLKEWVKSITKLTTSCNSFVRIITGIIDNNTSKEKRATRPIKILCTTNSDENRVNDKISNLFDVCLSIDKNLNSLRKKILNEKKFTYSDWELELNHFDSSKISYKNDEDKSSIDKNLKKEGKTLSDIKVVDKNGNENVILSLIFQLNQLLMIINNPMPFPHESYAKLFRKIGEKINEK